MEAIDKNTISNRASVCGAVLGAVSASYMYIQDIITGSGMGAVYISLLNIVLWAVKFSACITVMYLFMATFSKDFPDADRLQIKKVGVRSALYSSIIVALFSYLYYSRINPDYFAQSIEQVMDLYSSFLDSNSLQAMEKVEGSMPAYKAIGTLIYCFLYGTLLAGILSHGIAQKNIFAGSGDNYTDEQ